MKAACSFCLLVLFAATAAAEDWPQWQGPERTNVSRETGLLQSWPAEGPRQLWLSKEVGLGYSGIAVVSDTLYTMGMRGEDEYLIALNAADGTEKWSLLMGPRLSNNWGDGPRGTPTVDGGQVFALSGVGSLVCADAADGSLVWRVEMKDLGGRVPGWGYTESVLVDGDRVLCTPGGKGGAVAALNRATGEAVWQSEGYTEGAQYSSIIPIDHAGKHQFVQLFMNHLVGFDAADGAVLWKSDFPGKTAVIPTPIFHAGHVYITSGYGVGCKLVKLDGLEAVDVYENKLMKHHQGGVVLLAGKLYGYSDGPGWL